MNKFTDEQRLEHMQEIYDSLYNIALSKIGPKRLSFY